MGFGSIWHWIVVLVIVLLLFGSAKIPNLMGDVAKGIKNFKSGMKDDEDEKQAATKTIDAKTGETVDTNKSSVDDKVS
ncbi:MULTISPECIES: twin-arginine translocase TatA/TatE family subunit [unclassified Bartonella]|uniref:twin-arginine translocase TatA/TatE family subunit n=1 Tax=unclassified Bartonella TaxID=2645622 RepID=UPI0015FC6F93|nr:MULTISPECIES: twin-arginine translocase TatA/TatE family subunit [unclassified Bartonella]UXN04369.1 twin-arginine translocase TatA/TatE family subunit [Bartonella sp. HY406]UXN07363.1 twin-arginine translocase TatA/TatE family subunit [Bartonella sp. HY761]